MGNGTAGSAAETVTIGTGDNRVELVRKNVHGAEIYAEPGLRDNPEPLKPAPWWWQRSGSISRIIRALSLK
jgi:hypothetical protein